MCCWLLVCSVPAHVDRVHVRAYITRPPAIHRAAPTPDHGQMPQRASARAGAATASDWGCCGLLWHRPTPMHVGVSRRGGVDGSHQIAVCRNGQGQARCDVCVGPPARSRPPSQRPLGQATRPSCRRSISGWQRVLVWRVCARTKARQNARGREESGRAAQALSFAPCSAARASRAPQGSAAAVQDRHARDPRTREPIGSAARQARAEQTKGRGKGGKEAGKNSPHPTASKATRGERGRGRARCIWIRKAHRGPRIFSKSRASGPGRRRP